MTKKTTLSYAAVELAPAASPLLPASSSAAPDQNSYAKPEGDKTLREAASTVMLYLHPEAHKALKRYALDQPGKTKVHDLLLDAVEDWFRGHGLREPVRVQTSRTK